MKKDWEIKKFEDCIENVKYTTKIPSKDYKQEGSFPIVSQEEELISGYWDNENDLFSITKPVVIFGDHTRVLKYVDFDFVLGADGVKILQPKKFLDTKFFMYFLSNANIKHLGYARHYRLLKELNVFVPPLEEQKRIVKILDEKFTQLETIKANAQTNLQNAKDLFQSQLAKAFSNTTWEKKKLRDLTDSSLSYGSSSPSCEYDEKVRYIRITDINDEGFLNEEFVSPKFYDEKHILEDGDVLFARTGATVGKAYCYHNEDGKCVYAGYLIRLRPNQKIVIPDYIYLCTKSKEYEDFIKTSQAAAAQPNVNAEKYGNFEIPLPPLPEQKRIVKELDTLSEKVRQLQEIYTKQIANCDELKQSLLQKAFEGEL